MSTQLEPPGHPVFRAGGTYVITGGLGQIGSSIAGYLAREHGGKIAVVTSSDLPPHAERDAYLRRHGSGDRAAMQLRRLAEIRAHANHVIDVRADLSSPDDVRRMLDHVETELGTIDGVIHTAGRLRDRLLELAEPADHEQVIGAKARGAVVLAEELVRRGIEQLVLISSTSTLLAPPGQTSYVAANAVADALAGWHDGLHVSTVGFGVWSGGGMAYEAVRRSRLALDVGEGLEHPILHSHSEDAKGAHRYVGVLDARQDWVVDQHRVGTIAVLPGTAHLDLMLAALSNAGLTTCLTRVALHEPLVVLDDRPVTVRVAVGAPDESGVRSLSIESDLGRGLGWTLHSEAEHRPEPIAPPALSPWPSAGTTIDPLARPRNHLVLGPRWDRVVDAVADETRATAHLSTETNAAAEGWILEPAVADVATACAAALAPGAEDVLFVPIGYAAVASYAPLENDLHVTATRCDGSSVDVVLADVVIVAEGAVVATISGLQLRGVTELEHVTSPDVGHLATNGLSPLLAASMDNGILAGEGGEALERAVATDHSQVLVSSLDLDEVLLATQDDTGPDPAEVATERGGLLGSVMSAFQDLLGVGDVGPDSDFFELGGHSLIAIRLITRLRDLTEVRLQLSDLFEVPTPMALVARLVARRPELEMLFEDAQRTDSDPAPKASLAHPSLVPVRPRGDGRPLFVVHGAGGNVLNLWGIARHLPDALPVYGLQAVGIDGSDEPDPTIEAMAERYVDAIRTVQPVGPYLLGGYSGGGVVALEMSRQLQKVGDDVPLVVLLDTIPRNSERPSAARRYLNASRVALRRGPRSIVPYLAYSFGLRFDLVPHDIEALGLGFGDTSESGVVNLADHFEQLIEAYQFGAYSVDVVIAKAEKVYPAWPWHYGWKGRVLGRIDTFVSPGSHFEMFTSENAPVLASKLVPYLETVATR